MKKPLRAALSLMLTLCLLVGLLPTTAIAADDSFWVNGIRCYIRDGEVTITAADVRQGDVELVFPDEIRGYPVTCIQGKLFEHTGRVYYMYIEKVKLPAHLKNIGDYAFQNCQSLSDITFPETLESIGAYSFFACYALSDVDLPEGLKTIGRNAFEHCTALDTTLPGSLTTIGDYAFSRCGALSEVVFPETLTSIGSYAFQNCELIDTVVLPEKLEYIGMDAFSGCTLTAPVTLPLTLKGAGGSVYTGGGVSRFSSRYVNKSAFLNCGLDPEDIHFSPGATKVPDYLYAGFQNIEKAPELPQTITEIGKGAFASSSIKEITWPKDLAVLGEQAFSACENLRHVDIPAQLELKKSGAINGPFEYSGLSSVRFEAGRICIPQQMFAYCEKLETLYLPEGIERIERFAFFGSNLRSMRVAGPGKVYFEMSSFNELEQLRSIYFYGAPPEADYYWSRPNDKVAFYYPDGETSWKWIANYGEWKYVPCYPFQPELLLDEPLYNNGTEFHHLVYDYETGLPIQGARVVVDSATEVYTDADGVAVIPADAVTMTITAEGYLPETWPKEEPSDPETASLFAAQTKKKEHVTPLQKDQGKPTLTRITTVVSGAAHDIKTDKWGVNKQVPPASGTFGIGYTVSGNYHTLKVEQNGKTVATKPSAGASGNLYGIKMDDLQAGKPLSLVLCDKDGKELARQTLSNLKIVDEAPGTWSLALGDGAKVTVPSDIPFFGGTELQLKLPGLPGSVTATADGLRISVGGEVEGKNWDELKKNVKNAVTSKPKSAAATAKEIKDAANKGWNDLKNIRKLYKNATSNLSKPSWGKIKEAAANAAKAGKKGIKDALSPSIEVAGYIEKRWGDTGGEGQIVLALKLGAEAASNIQVGFVPTVLGVKLEGGVETGFTLKVTSVKTTWDLDADLGVGLEVDAGVGAKDILEVGIYGEGNSHWKFNVGTGKSIKLKEWKLHGGFGVRGKVLIFEAKKEVWSGDLYLIQNDKPVTSKSYATQAELMAFLSDVDSYQVMDRDYLAHRSGWLADGDGEDQAQLMALTQSAVKVMQTGTYPGVAPQLVTAGELVMLVYEDDAADRDDFNRTRLMYSLYNAANNTWAAPKAVTGDAVTAAQFSPAVREINGEVYALWQQAKTPITAEDGIEEAGAKLELTLARYDAAANAFTDVQTVTDNAVYELAPTLGVTAGGALSVCWLENGQNDPFGEMGQNSIYRAVKSGDGWTKELVAQSDRPVSAIRTGLVNGKETVAWIGETTVQAEDGPVEAAAAFARDMSGSEVQELDIAQSVYLIQVAGADALAWYDGAEVKYLTDLSADPAAASTLATLERAPQAILTGEDGRMSILYSGNHGEGAASNLYAMSYDPQTGVWGSPVALTGETELYVEALSSSYVGQDLVTVFRRVSVDNQENTTASLCWLRSQEAARLELTDARCVSETVALGQPAVIEATVRNAGTRASAGNETIALSGVSVDGSVTVPVLQGGEEVTLEISVTIPGALYTNSACTLTLGNSKLSVPLALADLAVEVEHYILGGRNVVVAIVTNVGWAPAEGRIALVRSGEESQTGVPFRQLAPGESVESVLTVENDFFGEEEGAAVTVSVLSDVQQQFLGNDSATVVLHKVYGGIAFESLTGGNRGLNGVLANASEESWTGTLILAAYDGDGKQMGCRVEDVTLESEKKLELNWSQVGAVRYRAFLLDQQLRPYLCETAKAD